MFNVNKAMLKENVKISNYCVCNTERMLYKFLYLEFECYCLLGDRIGSFT